MEVKHEKEAAAIAGPTRMGSEPSVTLNRRDFLKAVSSGLGAVGMAGLSGPAVARNHSWRWGDRESSAFHADSLNTALNRHDTALRVRLRAAEQQFALRVRRPPVNGDELRYRNFIANFSKGLPHNALGEVRSSAYAKLLTALQSADVTVLESLPLAGSAKLANPLGGVAYQLEGADSHEYEMVPPPPFASAEQGAEIVECYWAALLRDVPFDRFDDDSLTQEAAADLSKFDAYRDVTASSLFRGDTPEDQLGPYVSQFLWQDVPYGLSVIRQQYRLPVAGADFMTDYAEWLRIQNGIAASHRIKLDSDPRYILTGRDIAEWVHNDFPCQAYLNAGLILLGYGPDALDDAIPYKYSQKQSAFVTFGGPEIIDVVTRVASYALKAAWYQKWFVHRRLRPEVYAGRIHNHIAGNAVYEFDDTLLNSVVLQRTYDKYGSRLLPIAYPEGCPMHPAYPAGHAVIAGACTTVLKAYFKHDIPVQKPKIVNSVGSGLNPYDGKELSVGGELNKLAANIARARDIAGVHWRSDSMHGLRLGEAVALRFLQDQKVTYRERFAGLTLTKFDGSVVTT